MPLENICKLEKNYLEFSKTLNNKQIIYDPDNFFHLASPLSSLQIHWHQGILPVQVP